MLVPKETDSMPTIYINVDEYPAYLSDEIIQFENVNVRFITTAYMFFYAINMRNGIEILYMKNNSYYTEYILLTLTDGPNELFINVIFKYSYDKDVNGFAYVKEPKPVIKTCLLDKIEISEIKMIGHE